MATRSDTCESFLGTVTVGERGQIVIPAEARKALEIHTGDRLFIMGHPSREGLVMFKVEAMRDFLNHLAANLSMIDEDIVAPGNVRTTQSQDDQADDRS